MRGVFCLLLMLHVCCLHAQSDWREALREWMGTEDLESSYHEGMMDMLEEKAASPLNLNEISREDLEELPFLNAQQVEDIVAYVDRYQPVRSMSELFMIPSLDWYTRRLLGFFVYVGEGKKRQDKPGLKGLGWNGKHTVSGSVKIPFYERKGDRNGYLGYPYRHDVRYQYNDHNRLKWGITGAQDAGEPFLSNKNKWGYDHYNYYFQIRDRGWLKELNIGMYQVKMGMGLLMNTGFHLGKMASLLSQGRSTHLLTAHSSRSAADYLHGMAATVRMGERWQATAFWSSRGIDATLNKDGTVRTLVNSGYHRTATEMDKKHNTTQRDMGGSIGYQRRAASCHFNMVYTFFDRALVPQQVEYRRYGATGRRFLNMSMDYRYAHGAWTVQGENAVDGKGGVACLNTINWHITPAWSCMVLHRYYDKRYTALHAHSFSECGESQNEHGVYVGMDWRIGHRLTVKGYADYAYFPWARYRVATASDAFDTQWSAYYTKGKWTVDGRYRLHIRQRDNEGKTAIVNRYEHRLRCGVGCQLTDHLTLHGQGDGVLLRTTGRQYRGGMVSQQAKWKGECWRVDAHLGWFYTEGYDARIYVYEPSVSYDFSYLMLYGHGIRYALMAGCDIGSRLSVTAKVGVTKYFDRTVAGSGLQQVSHSALAEGLVMVRWVI